ncbi:MAG TPA: transposase, partial [Chondromyces sp.]|nr:transposase [Chondromyces sp.]
IGQYVRREFPRFIQVPSDSPSSEQPCPSTPTKTEKLTAGEQKKWELIRRVQARFKENVRKSDLIREFSIDRKTLNKYLKMKEPLRHKRDRQHSAEPYREMIIALLRKQTTVKHIFHILQEQGYNKSFSTLRNYILKIRKQEELNKEGMAKTKLSRRRLHLYLWSRLQCLPDEEEKFQRLFEKYRQLGKLKMLLQSFQHIMDEQKTELALKEWTEEIAESGIVELQQFADYLQSDWTAVKNVLLYSWSNGPVEGHVNKLKVIKRQMYGRANFDLLSKKILYQS